MTYFSGVSVSKLLYLQSTCMYDDLIVINKTFTLEDPWLYIKPSIIVSFTTK